MPAVNTCSLSGRWTVHFSSSPHLCCTRWSLPAICSGTAFDLQPDSQSNPCTSMCCQPLNSCCASRLAIGSLFVLYILFIALLVQWVRLKLSPAPDTLPKTEALMLSRARICIGCLLGWSTCCLDFVICFYRAQSPEVVQVRAMTVLAFSCWRGIPTIR